MLLFRDPTMTHTDPLLALSPDEQEARSRSWMAHPTVQTGRWCRNPEVVLGLLSLGAWQEASPQDPQGVSLWVLRGLVGDAAFRPEPARVLTLALATLPGETPLDLWPTHATRARFFRDLISRELRDPEGNWRGLRRAFQQRWPQLLGWASTGALPYSHPLAQARRPIAPPELFDELRPLDLLAGENPAHLQGVWLEHALRRDDAILVQMLMAQGVRLGDTGVLSDAPQPPIHQAARQGAVACLPLFRPFVEDWNQADAWGMTPGHAAIQGFLAVKFDTQTHGFIPKTAEELAASAGRVGTVLCLLRDLGVDLERPTVAPPKRPRRKPGDPPLAKLPRRHRNASLPGETALGSLVRREAERDFPPGTHAALQAMLLRHQLDRELPPCVGPTGDEEGEPTLPDRPARRRL